MRRVQFTGGSFFAMTLPENRFPENQDERSVFLLPLQRLPYNGLYYYLTCAKTRYETEQVIALIGYILKTIPLPFL